MKYEINQKIFSEKLRKLLKEKKIVNKKGEANQFALYNLLYPNDKITDKLLETDRPQATIKARKVDNWIKGTDYPKKPQDMIDLCNCLNCDFDYFFTSMETPTHDLDFISKEIHLSHNAIQNIQAYDEHIINILDRLITNNDDLLKFLLDTLYRYIYSSSSTVTIDNSILGNTQKMDKKESIELLKYSATKSFELILRSIDDLYAKDLEKAYENKIKMLELENEITHKEFETIRNARSDV